MKAEEEVIDGMELVLRQEENHNNDNDEMSDFDVFDHMAMVMADNEGHYICEKVRNFYRNCQRLEAKDATLTQLHLFTWGGRFDVDLNDRLAIILGSVLFHNATLQLLTVKVGPALTTRGAKALRQGMASCKALDDVRIYMASEDVNVRRILYRGLVLQASLTNLEINSEHDVSEICRVPTRVRNLELNLMKRKYLPESPTNSSPPQSFFESLANTTNLRAMRAAGWNWRSGESCIRDFGVAWRNSTSLRTLFLSKNYITNESLNVLMGGHAWPHPMPLKTLYLCHNAIDSDGALLLLRAIANHPTLEVLTLDHNTNIGYAGLQLIGNEVHTLRQLKFLSLTYCATDASPLQQMAESDSSSDSNNDEATAVVAARIKAARALLEGIKANHSLLTFGISNNGLPMEEEIYWYVEFNQFGRSLLLQRHMPATVWCHVLAKCHRRPQRGNDLLYYFLREQPHLVQTVQQRH
jgi:hypothetical protein